MPSCSRCLQTIRLYPSSHESCITQSPGTLRYGYIPASKRGWGQTRIHMCCQACLCPLLQCSMCFSIISASNMMVSQKQNGSESQDDVSAILMPKLDLSLDHIFVKCSCCSFPNVIDEKARIQLGFTMSHPGWGISLEKFIVLCFQNNQTLDFGAQAQTLLDVHCGGQYGHQTNTKRKRFRRRNKTIDFRIGTLSHPKKQTYQILLDLENIVEQGYHISHIAAHLYRKERIGFFSRHDEKLLKLALNEVESFLPARETSAKLLSIASFAAELDQRLQRYRIVSLKELAFGLSSNQADQLCHSTARSHLNFCLSQESYGITRIEIESWLNVTSALIFNLICKNLQTPKSSPSYRNCAKILRSSTCEEVGSSRSLHLLHILIKLYSTLIIIC